MKTKELQLDISKAMSLCLRNGIKVEPIISGRKFKIQVTKPGEVKVYDKEIGSKEVNHAVSSTYKYFATLILKEKEDANNA